MKLSKLTDPQFQVALRKLASQELPLKGAFAIKGIVKKANEELVKYDEVRNEALQRLGTKNEDGSLSKNESGSVDLSEENMQLFVKELGEMLSMEIHIGSLKASDLGDKINLSANDLMALDVLIE